MHGFTALRNLSVLLIICLVLPGLAQSQESINSNIDISIDSRVELISIIFRLAGMEI